MADGDDILQLRLEDTRREVISIRIVSIVLGNFLNFPYRGKSDLYRESRDNIPVEVLRGADSDDSVGIGQAGEDTDP